MNNLNTYNVWYESSVVNGFLLCCYYCRQIDGIAPTFAKKPSIRQEDDGKRLIFECRIEADPTPTVNWWHNAAQVNPGARHKVDIYIIKKIRYTYN